jgi:hypothetical protein
LIKHRFAVTSRRKSVTGAAAAGALLAAVLLLPAVCLAVTVPGTAAETGKLLSGFHDVPEMPYGAVTDANARVLPGLLGEPGISLALDRPLSREKQPAAAAGESDARLFLFVLLGFAALAAWLAELLGRKR